MSSSMAVVTRFLYFYNIFLVLAAAIIVQFTTTAFAQTSSTVAINPTQGPPGTSVTGSGTNWQAGDRMQVSGDNGEVLANNYYRK